jgi:hypothetical protein
MSLQLERAPRSRDGGSDPQGEQSRWQEPDPTWGGNPVGHVSADAVDGKPLWAHPPGPTRVELERVMKLSARSTN